MGFLRRSWKTLLGGIVGASAGGLYAHFIGCRTGTCPLTSNVWIAAIFFGITGALALSGGSPAREGRAEMPGANGTDPAARERP